jgi:hypothetical protein
MGVLKMTTLNIQIRLDNAAFEGDGLENELHHVLSAIQFKIARGQTQNHVYDTNGNNVAEFKIIEG